MSNKRNPVNFKIIMPFNRPKNAEAVKTGFTDATQGMKGSAELIAVCSDKSYVGLFYSSNLVFLMSGFDICYWKINRTLDQIELKSDTFYGFICDDDLYEPDFFKNLEKAIGNFSPRVIVINMKRWYHESNPKDELFAEPENMRVCHVGLEQIFIRGDIMEKYRFKNFPHGDGDLVERLYKDMPNDFIFLRNNTPHLFVNWNKLPA